MKKYILILVSLFSYFGYVNAQETIVPIEQQKGFDRQPNVTYYFKDVNGALAKFTGTWKYQTATESFEITFYFKHKSDAGGMFFEDELYSKFKYIKNGVEIYNTYQENYPLYFFGGFFAQPNNINKLNLSYREPNVAYNSPRKRLDLEYIPATGLGGSATLHWSRDIWQTSPTAPPFKLPKNMILVKQ